MSCYLQRLHGEAEVSCIEEQLLSKRNAFEALRQENMECEQNAEDYRMKMSERCRAMQECIRPPVCWFVNAIYCVIIFFFFVFLFVSEKAVQEMREQRKQMLLSIIDNDERWEEAEEEVAQVVARHGVTRATLDERQKLTFAEEQRTKVRLRRVSSFNGWNVRDRSCSSVLPVCSTERDRKAEAGSDGSDERPGATEGKFTIKVFLQGFMQRFDVIRWKMWRGDASQSALSIKM